jgi:hypothetical protein
MSGGAGLIQALLALAIVLIVPLGVRLHPDLGSRWTVPFLAAGVPAAGSLLVAQGRMAALLAAPWVIVAGVGAAVAAAVWLRGSRRVLELAWLAAPAYLAFGAVWLVLDRAAVEPVGVAPPFVLLTAVHFHYAGFIAALLVSLVRARVGDMSPRGTTVAVIAVVGAPPVIAAGFALVGVLQIVGAVVLTAGLLLAVWLTMRLVVPGVEDRTSRVLLIVSSLAVVVPMALAVQWAVGWNYGTPALSIPAMARTHGVLNAVGFSMCGVLGWLRLQESGS